MDKELVIDVSGSDISIALLEDKQLVELHKEVNNQKFSVGDIYLARVKKIMSGLNAAFIDVGYEKDAFLHYLDLGSQFNSQMKYIKQALNPNLTLPPLSSFQMESEIDKDGKISDVLAGGQVIIVQIAKEPISTKGPRLSSEISIAGRNLVLIPFSNKVSVSQKLKSKEERIRLKKLIQSIKPENFGVIVRTVAKNRRVAALDEELRSLVKKWEMTTEKIRDLKIPELLIGELDRPAAILRDIVNSTFNSITVNDTNVFNHVVDFIEKEVPEKQNIVKFYKSNTPIFEHFGIEKQIKGLFGKTVTFKSGAYLIIEHTEALHVIDVNSGNRSKKTNDQETNATEVNILAAEEIARQLRLRDMGGIIVVDFIDMQSFENRKKVYEKMKEEMEKDRTKHSILPLSKFGLMQITRQRVRPETNIETNETCPVCDGTGEVTSSILFVDDIENHLRYIASNIKGNLTLKVHPYIAGYLSNGLLSRKRKWMLKHKRIITIKSEISYYFLEYHFFDKNGDEVKE